jgi:hypothetical protein
MTRDDELIREITRLAACNKLVNEAELSQIRLDIEEYRVACRLSNGKDKQRNAAWSTKAYDLGHVLKGWFKQMTGRDYLDMKWFQRCDKCEEQ